jgi:two-component system, OmpR family, sensor histidine kinase MprB
MTFRLRLALAAAFAVAATVVIASVIVFIVMRSELRKNVDADLTQNAETIVADLQHRGGFALRDLSEQGMFASGGGPATIRNYIQLVDTSGQTGLLPGYTTHVPVTASTRAVASGKQGPYFTDATVGGIHSRVYTVQVAGVVDGANNKVAIQLVQGLDEVDRALHRLELILLLVSLGGIAAAAAGGALVSRSALVPVRRLSDAAERIAKTQDPSERVPAGNRDELARLGASFNTMLGALQEAIETQRRFVADASHELRTPLTSMQTNIDVLKEQDRLDPEARQRLFDDLQRESQEMRNLIGGLIELARGDDPRLERTQVQLDELVENSVERARSRFPQLTFETSLEPATADGVPERLERAVWNLLENAGKWSKAGATVEVTLADGELRVRDHGPGIAPEDRPHVFERFYRATAARALPGSGLGLSIVRDVAEEHGGTVSAEDAPGGGALLRLRLTNS